MGNTILQWLNTDLLPKLLALAGVAVLTLAAAAINALRKWLEAKGLETHAALVNDTTEAELGKLVLAAEALGKSGGLGEKTKLRYVLDGMANLGLPTSASDVEAAVATLGFGPLAEGADSLGESQSVN